MGFEHPDYDDVTPLAKGGMAEVFRARHVPLERPVAVKVMLDGADEHGVERMLQEARLVAKLRHPNLVHVYDAGQLPGGRPYVVMECIEGNTLARCARPMSVGVALTLVGQVAAALGVAHDVGVIHRDVKPSNILLDSSADGPVAKLADFGIARTEDSDITRTGTALGTPAYMAPESFRGETVPASDVYGLGLILYELLTGERPFKANMPARWMAFHLDEHRPELPDELEVPDKLRALFDRMVALAPEDRPRDGTECALAIRDVLADIDPTLSIPVSGKTRTHERQAQPSNTSTLSMTWIGVGAAALGTGGLAIGAFVLVLGIGVGVGGTMYMAEEDAPHPSPQAAVPEPAPAAAATASQTAPEPEPEPEAEPEPAAEAPEAVRPTPSPPEPEPVVAEAPAKEEPEPEPAPAPAPAPAPEPEPEPEPAEEEAAVAVAEPAPRPPPPFPEGTFRGEAGGRPLTITLSGPADAVTGDLELRIGAEVAKRSLTGRATADGSCWRVELVESGGNWRLDGTLERSFTGTLWMGKRSMKVEASP